MKAEEELSALFAVFVYRHSGFNFSAAPSILRTILTDLMSSCRHVPLLPILFVDNEYQSKIAQRVRLEFDKLLPLYAL